MPVTRRAVERTVKTIARAVGAASAARSAAQKFKSKGKSHTRTKTKEGKSEAQSRSADYSRTSVSLGKKPKRDLKQLYKYVDAQKSVSQYAFRLYNQFASSSGRVQLANVSTSTSTGALTVPCNVWDITSVSNVVGGTVTNPLIAWYPSFSDPTGTGTLSWGNAYNLALESSDNTATVPDNYPCGQSTLDWYNMKLMCYAPTSIPCRWQIDVVQFKDQRLNPETTTQTPFATGFWQSMVKPFAYSPLETGDTSYKKYMKVLYSKSWIMNPKETTDPAPAIMKQVNLFQRLNRSCKFNWSDEDAMNMLAVDGEINLAPNKTTVHPRARIYVIIRASANNATAFTTTLHPTYDIVYKVQHSQLSS